MTPSRWLRMPFSQAVEVNPRRIVARGTLAPFVDMAALPTEIREVRPRRVRPVGGGGSRFTNGDTLFARITPCTENERRVLSIAYPRAKLPQARRNSSFCARVTNSPCPDSSTTWQRVQYFGHLQSLA